MDTRNTVVLVGRLVADPELKYLPKGTPVANFSIAVNRPIRKDDGSFEDALDGFFDCVLYGGIGVSAADILVKGTEVQLAGHLRQRKFESKGGHKVSRIEVNVRSIGATIQPAKTEAPVSPGAQGATPAAAAPAAQPA